MIAQIQKQAGVWHVYIGGDYCSQTFSPEWKEKDAVIFALKHGCRRIMGTSDAKVENIISRLPTHEQRHLRDMGW